MSGQLKDKKTDGGVNLTEIDTELSLARQL